MIWTMMRPIWALSILAFALGCGRSDLNDELLIDFDTFDASPGFDAGTTDDASLPVMDASSRPPPPRDAVAPPPSDAAMVPGDASGGGGPPPFCDAVSCSTGCCYGNICALGNQSIACGGGGGECVDCTRSGQTSDVMCVSGACVPILK
jgi:hypothetical protein